MITRRSLLMGAGAGAAASATALLAASEVRPWPPRAGFASKGQTGLNKITFAVDSVQPATTPLPTQAARDTIAALLNSPRQPLESWSTSAPDLVDYGHSVEGVHPFLLAVTTAYDRHYPLVLSPDMIWLLILQGFASHVNANSEALRKKFVAHEGKLVVNVQRDNFRKGDPANDWEGVFAELSSKLRTHIGPAAHDLIVNEISTTGTTEKAAMEVALLDTLQSYFVYLVTTACGFPSITLEGTTGDWQQLRARAQQLQSYDLDWWIPHLLPVLDEFVRASQNRPSREFWCNFYKLSVVGSGDSHIQGHILNLFPYFGGKRPSAARLIADFETFLRGTLGSPRTEDEITARVAKFKDTLARGEGPWAREGTLRRNPFIGRDRLDAHEGMTTADVLTKMSSAPMVWDYFGTPRQMELLAGFVGATQDKVTMAFRPQIGWAVRQGLS
jgi:hypothetical protein